MTAYWRGNSHLRQSRHGGRRGGLKSEDFRGNVIYGWPCGLNLEQLKNILSKFLISWLHKFAEKLNQGKIRNIDHSNILRLNQFAETVARRCSIQKCS